MRKTVMRSASAAALALVGCLHDAGRPVVAPTATLGNKPEEVSAHLPTKLGIAFSGPHGAVSSNEEAIVTILFDRPMRTLDQPDDASALGATIKTKDGRAPKGRWLWVGAHGLVFEPDAHLPHGSDFEVVVPAGATSADGLKLGVEHRLSFTTAPPRVTYVSTSGQRDLAPDQEIRVELDQPVDPAKIKASAHLVAIGATSSEAARSIAINVRYATSVPKGREHAIVQVTPAEKLPLDRRIELVFDAGLVGVEGPRGTAKEQRFSMRTYGPLALKDVVCNKATIGRCVAAGQVDIELTNRVVPAELLSHLEVKGGEPARLLVEKSRSLPRTRHTIVRNSKAGKRYHVTLRKGLRDVFGQTLDHDLDFDVDTEEPFVGGDKKTPVATPTATTTIEAPRAPLAEPKGVAHRAQLDFEAEIGIRGNIVEALASTGLKSHVVPIGVVNVPTYGTFAASLAESELGRWLDGTIQQDGPTGGGWTWMWRSPGLPPSTRAVTSIDLDALLGGAGKSGAAMLAMTIPGSMGAPTSKTLLDVTDLGVSARMSRHGGLVWVTKLSTGLPVAGAKVTIVRTRPTKDEKAIALDTTTDDRGLATIPQDAFDPIGDGMYGPAGGTYVLVHAGEDWTYQLVERGRASAQSFWDVDLDQRATMRGLLFTDRGVYRPGETVKLAGLARALEGDAMKATPGQVVRVTASGDDGATLFEGRTAVDAFGAFTIDVAVPKSAKLGTLSIHAALGNPADPKSPSVTLTTEAMLAAYKASAFDFQVSLDGQPFVRGDSATLKATGTYLYGAPMIGATLRTTVTRAPVAFTPPQSEGFTFGDESAPYAPSGSLVAPEGDLDDNGAFSAPIPLDLPRQLGPERVTAEVEVEDETKQTVTRTASAIVHPAEFYVGLRRDGARFVTVKDATKLAGLVVSPEVAAFDPSGKHRAGVAVKLELVSKSWTSAVGEQSDGSALSLSAPVEKVIATCTATTTDKTASCPLKVSEIGFYIVRATAKDARGNESEATSSLYVLTETPTPTAQTFARSDQKTMKIEPEKLKYKAGETARLLVHNPFAHAEALITIERAGVLDRRVVTLDGPMPVIEVPLTREHFPNVFVSIELVRGRVQAPPKSGLDLGGPDTRVGVVELTIEPDSHRLKVAVTPSNVAFAPGESLTTDVAVTDSEGKPAEATLTFYAVDEGVLMLTGYKTPDPLPTFAERRRLGVFGFESREHLATIVPMLAGEKVPILGWEVASDGWSKGSSYGGGGGEEAGKPSARADFRATAFFEAGRVTSFDGHAHFEWKLPDNLTSYRLMAIAAARDDRFGFGQTNITASKSLMIRPALPRQLRVGDDFEASFVVTTKGLPASDVDVSLAPLPVGKSLVVDGPLTQRVHVNAGAQASVRFHVKATHEGSATLDVTAKTGASSDRVTIDRHVDQPRVDRVETAYGEGTAPASVAIGALQDRLPDHGGARVQLASSALVGLASGFEQLVDYPYGCTEQVASRTLPMLSMLDLATQAGARLPAKTDDFIADGVAKLLAHEQWSGGFGFWDDDPPIAWLSAYATLTLEQAAKHGHEVPKEARDRAVRFLRSALTDDLAATRVDDLPSGKPHDEEGEVDLDPAANRDRAIAEAAMIADVLATIGAPDAGAIETLYDSRAKLPLFGRALLLHAMVVSKLPAATTKPLADEIVASLVVTDQTVSARPEGPVFAPMLDSGTRTSAMVLRALLAFDPKHPLASKLARGILAARTHGAWASTQETVWSLMALDDYRRAQEAVAAKIDAEVFLGEASIFKATLTGIEQQSVSVPASAIVPGASITIDRKGQGTLFWATELRWSTASMPTMPVDDGLFVDKRIRTVTPSELTEALKSVPKARAPDPKALLETKVKVGEMVLIDLLVETVTARDQVVIDDPLPAGLEPIDVRLATVAPSAATTEGPMLAHAIASSRERSLGAPPTFTLHREQRDDRVLTFAGHLDPGLYHFRYLARATSVGRFVTPPTTVAAMYDPDTHGRTAASIVEVVRE